MGGGGIINQRAAVLLIAVTDPCIYAALPTGTKAAVDAIDAKDPMNRTEDDVKCLICAIVEVMGGWYP